MWNKIFSNPSKLSTADQKTMRELQEPIYAVYAQLEDLTKAQAIRVLLFVLRSIRHEWPDR